MSGLSAHLDALITLAPVLLVPLPQVLLFVVLICIVTARSVPRTIECH